MKNLILLLCCMITGCASVGDYYDARDPCQHKGKPAEYKLPNFCGAAGRETHTIHDAQGRKIGSIRSKQ